MGWPWRRRSKGRSPSRRAAGVTAEGVSSQAAAASGGRSVRRGAGGRVTGRCAPPCDVQPPLEGGSAPTSCARWALLPSSLRRRAVVLRQLSDRLVGQPAAVPKIGPRPAAQLVLLPPRADLLLMSLTLSLNGAERLQPRSLTRLVALVPSYYFPLMRMRSASSQTPSCAASRQARRHS